MIKLILLLIFVATASMLLSLIGDDQGSLVAYWMGYKIDAPASTIIKICALLILCIIIATVLVTKFFSLFHGCSDRKMRKLSAKYENHMEHLASGFISIVSGNIKNSEREYENAEKYIKKTTLSNLLKAQIEYSKKNYSLAAQLFKNSKKTKDVELDLIAEKLYLQDAKKGHDNNEIIKHCEKLIKSDKASDYVALSLIKAYKEKHDWNHLEETINYSLCKKILDTSKDRYEIASTYALLGKHYLDNKEYKKSLEYAKKSCSALSSIPGSIVLAKSYIGLGRKLCASSFIKKAWKYNPHPELYNVYYSLYTNLKPEKILGKVKKLAKYNPEHYESYVALANAYFEAGKLDKSREAARNAVDERKTSSVYEILAKIEKEEDPKSKIIKVLEEKARNAKHKYTWVCQNCGKHIEEWNKICEHCNNADSLEWSSVELQDI